SQLFAQKKAVLAYYAGTAERLDSFDVSQMTHLIFCFGHLDSNRLQLRSAKDTAVIQKMVGLKVKNPSLKVLLSLGGWGGCEPCSAAFSTPEGRTTFVQSVKEMTAFFGTDGIDLDWEYPTIAGYPGHPYSPADKENFTGLVKDLRKALGKKKVITFAAGGFQRYLELAVDWKNVMRYVNYVNLMSYDLVSGFSTTTGHHTALYSTPQQKESTDNAVQYLLAAGVDPKKIIIGAAFYSRVWENVAADNNGLYQSGKFRMGVDFRQFPQRLSTDSGFVFYWDEMAGAPYAYHPEKQWFATFDDKHSVALKTEYVLKHKLGGIMFWQLGSDSYNDGLLQTINE
ncbi:MAG TPA: glycoside hydrolase family 18 protein, partial [Flavisolibacter sp.]|nr:glycoside hydrolase family 18 protein [Flavisolibacter sp.]